MGMRKIHMINERRVDVYLDSFERKQSTEYPEEAWESVWDADYNGGEPFLDAAGR